jgi:hypothetical protein
MIILKRVNKFYLSLGDENYRKLKKAVKNLIQIK